METETLTTTKVPLENLFGELQLPSAPKSDTERYHLRSQVFSSNAGVNPLVACSQAILALLDRIKQSKHYPDAGILHQQLQYEIKAFAMRARAYNFPHEVITIASILLCATVDDIIQSTKWGQLGHWRQYCLLQTEMHIYDSQDHFFAIYERIIEDPSNHIELLELMYLCLSGGYQGQYRQHSNGSVSLETLLENLYQQIRRERVDFRKNLLITPLTQLKTPTAKKTVPLWVIVSVACTLLLTLFFGFNYLLDVSSQPISQQLETISQQIMHTNQEL